MSSYSKNKKSYSKYKPYSKDLEYKKSYGDKSSKWKSNSYDKPKGYNFKKAKSSYSKSSKSKDLIYKSSYGSKKGSWKSNDYSKGSKYYYSKSSNKKSSYGYEYYSSDSLDEEDYYSIDSLDEEDYYSSDSLDEEYEYLLDDFPVYKYNNKSKMSNVSGSSKCKCFKEDFRDFEVSYKRIYEDLVTDFKECRFEGCNNLASCGGHLKKSYGKSNWYIVPICSSCNHTSRDGLKRKLKKNTRILKVTCKCPN